MSRLFTASSSNVTFGTAALPTPAGSIVLWYYPVVAKTSGQDRNIFFVYNGSNFCCIEMYSNNQLYVGWSTGTDYRIVIPTANIPWVQYQWASLILTWNDTTNETYFYWSGAQIGAKTDSLITHTTTVDKMIGCRVSTNTICQGRVAEFAVFNVVLSANERAAFDRGILPNHISPTQPVDYLPLWGVHATEPNLIPGRTQGTVYAATAANHAPVQPFSRKFWGSYFGPLPAGSAVVKVHITGFRSSA